MLSLEQMQWRAAAHVAMQSVERILGITSGSLCIFPFPSSVTRVLT